MRYVKEGRDRFAVDQRSAEIENRVSEILRAVRDHGEDAVRQYSAELDDWNPPSFRLLNQEADDIVAAVPKQVLDDIRFAQDQIRGFAEAQLASLSELSVETMPGVVLGHKHIPVESVACYVPGGRYPLVASAHMGIVTAKVAGVPRVVACTPPMAGAPNPETVAAMVLAGADEIYLLGGAQALAAMAYGTEEITPVDMIVGPGNAYVAEAKRQLFGRVGIDLLPGPTEVLIVADETADAEMIATDLLGQAEHGPDSVAILITTSETLAEATLEEVQRQLKTLKTAEIAAVSWRDYGTVVVVDDLVQAVALANDMAAEHVQIFTAEPSYFLENMRNYGSLFLGPETTVSFGDKLIGTNHILPTMGAARYTGGLWVGKFLKTCTFQRCTPEASARLAKVCSRLCEVENFWGHKAQADLRARRYGTE